MMGWVGWRADYEKGIERGQNNEIMVEGGDKGQLCRGREGEDERRGLKDGESDREVASALVNDARQVKNLDG